MHTSDHVCVCLHVDVSLSMLVIMVVHLVHKELALHNPPPLLFYNGPCKRGLYVQYIYMHKDTHGRTQLCFQ